nr:MAG TPA: hypothetical protein [Caudoviricetes sp.]
MYALVALSSVPKLSFTILSYCCKFNLFLLSDNSFALASWLFYPGSVNVLSASAVASKT